MNAPKLWPPDPVSVISIVPGRQSRARRSVGSPRLRASSRRCGGRCAPGARSGPAARSRGPAAPARSARCRAPGRDRGPGHRTWCSSVVPCCGSTAAEQRPQVEPGRLPVPDGGFDVEALDVADRLVERAEAERRRGTPAPRRRRTVKKVSTSSGRPAEALAQLGVLGRDPDRARVEMAGAHHHAAEHDERCRREAELLGTEQRGDDDVAARLHLAVDLDDDPVAQGVAHEGLLGLGEPELPRCSGVLERGERRRPGAAVLARR